MIEPETWKSTWVAHIEVCKVCPQDHCALGEKLWYQLNSTLTLIMNGDG